MPPARAYVGDQRTGGTGADPLPPAGRGDRHRFGDRGRYAAATPAGHVRGRLGDRLLHRLGDQRPAGQRHGRGGGEPVPGPAGVTVGARSARAPPAGVEPAWQSSAPSPPRVTATAPTRQRSRSPCAPRDAVISRDAPGVPPASSRTSTSFGRASRTPGTAAGPRGCGSQTTGAVARPSAARSAGCAATPRP